MWLTRDVCFVCVCVNAGWCCSASAIGPAGAAMPSLIYSFVARGTTILVEYTAFSGNFATLAIQCLQKCPQANNSKFTYTCDRHTFNFLVADGFSASRSLSPGRFRVSGPSVSRARRSAEVTRTTFLSVRCSEMKRICSPFVVVVVLFKVRCP